MKVSISLKTIEALLDQACTNGCAEYWGVNGSRKVVHTNACRAVRRAIKRVKEEKQK
jgi:hypothetical protein